MLGTSLLSFSLVDSDEIITTPSSVVDVGFGEAFPFLIWLSTREDSSDLDITSLNLPLSVVRSSTVRGMGGTGVFSSLESGPGSTAGLEPYKAKSHHHLKKIHDIVH